MFYDFFVNMENCKFDDNKESVKFEMCNKIVLCFYIIDLIFFGNKECIVVVFNGVIIR